MSVKTRVQLLLTGILFIVTGLAHAWLPQGINLNKVVDVVQKSADAAKDTTQQEEITIGRNFAATLLGATPLLDDEELQTYVNLVGAWVASHSERPDLPWRFAVLDTSSVNAMAAPGGYIFITKGMLELTSNEAELAGILAHEIVHVLEQHHLNAMKKSASVDLLRTVGAIAASTTGNDTVATVLNSDLTDFAKKLYTSGLDKSDEYEADLHGVVLAARAGYDPYGLPSVLYKINAIQNESSAFALMFATHPKTDTRLENLQTSMVEPMEPYEAQATLDERFASELQI